MEGVGAGVEDDAVRPQRSRKVGDCLVLYVFVWQLRQNFLRHSLDTVDHPTQNEQRFALSFKSSLRGVNRPRNQSSDDDET